MTREEFLSLVWRPYPAAFPELKSWFCGRVIEKSEDRLTLLGDGVSKEWMLGDCTKKEHPLLGSSIPAGLLKPGDWVALSENQSAIWLFSPTLVDTPTLFNTQEVGWAEFLKRVEEFFLDQGFLHLRTPFLVQSPGVDHHIDFLTVEATTTKRRWSLPTSPEIHLKKALCRGSERVFEIKSSFRDDLPGEHHSAEFTMLEWYRAFGTLKDLQEDISGLISFLAPSAPSLRVRALPKIFEDQTGFALTPRSTRQDLIRCAENWKIEWQADDDWNDLFFRIFMERVEPGLGSEGPEVITQFPPQQASLAQISGEGWAQRFELYWNGVELANAYLEVNDPGENQRRFHHQLELRKQAGKVVAPLDEDFFQLMKSGMPPASGIALGLNRVYRILSQSPA